MIQKQKVKENNNRKKTQTHNSETNHDAIFF